MKEMIKRVRDEKGGFTLAELLIVVAIILVLVAIAIPVFTGALNSANTAVSEANIRSVKAQAVTDYLLNSNTLSSTTYYVSSTGDVSTTAPSGTYRTYNVSASGSGNNVQITVTENTGE